MLAEGLVGIHEGMSSIDYHGSPGLSFTALKEFLRSPAHYKAYHEEDEEQTDSQKLGSAFHALILEPEVFKKTYVHIGGPMNRNPFKAEADAAKAEGMVPIGDSMWKQIMGMGEAVMQHPEAAGMLKAGKKEVAFFAEDPDSGVLIKCKADIWMPELCIVGDPKSCSDARADVFIRTQLMKLRYDVQSAFYLKVISLATGIKHSEHVHICVETAAPHGVMLHALDDASLERSELTVRGGLLKFAECMKQNFWPGLPTGINPIAIPSWAFEENEL